jgi:hypothetical protein
MIDQRIHTDAMVKAILRGEENRLIRIHATGPVVRTGGGRSGWVPGVYFLGD